MNKLQLCMIVIVTFIALHVANVELLAQDQQQSQLLVNNNRTANILQWDKDQVPLADLLSRLEEKFSVTFLYDHKTVANKFVSRSKASLSENPGPDLSRILQELGLEYDEIHEGIFLLMPKQGLLEKVSLMQTVSGTVTDAQSGETLPGVNVIVKGTTTGTSTDSDGAFELTVESLQDTLIFSFVGYQTQEVPINGRTEIDVALQSQAITGEELVVVGYGTQEKVNVTGAISSVDASSLEEVNTVNATELIQGKISGVHTRQSSGQPGADDVNINIRGFGSPLVLVDGIERNLSDVDPESIESISVLKDASAAVYGARAGNGVVLVTTKRGDFGRDLEIKYDGSFSAQEFTNKPRVITDAGRYLEMFTEAERNVGITPTYSESEIERYKQREPGYESYDWFDYAYNSFAPRTKHNLTVNGGGQNVSFYTNIGFSNQGGMISSNDWYYDRYNIRANLDGKITKNLTASLNLNYVNEEQSEARPWIWRDVYKSQPMAPTHFPNSDLIPASNLVGTHQRLVGEMNKDIEGGWTRNRDRIYGQIELEYHAPFVDGLSSRARLDFQKNNFRNKQTLRQWEVYTRDPETGEYQLDGRFPADVQNSMLALQHASFNRLQPRIDIEFDRDFEKHSINALLLAEYIEDYTNNFNAQTENLLSRELEYMFLGDPTYHAIDQFVEDMSRGSIVGRLQYSFDDKYMVEGTFRYDGSSVFPPDGRWGFFPSVSAGWRISEEPFFNITNLDELKVRASYSKMGYDQNAIAYDYFFGYNVTTVPPYIFGNQPSRRIQPGSLPNEDMTWEKMDTYNVGIDFSFLQGKFEGMVDAFYRKRTDILAEPIVSLPSTFGASLPQQNLNSMDNRGMEFELTYNNNISDFNYSITGNLTYSRAKWIHFEEEAFESEAERRVFQQSGKWVNRSVGYVTDGLFRTEEEIENHPVDQDQADNSTLKPGDIKYVDLNGDGLIDFQDQKTIGYGTGMPELNYGLDLGLNYKGLQLHILFQGASMFSGYISGLTQVPFRNASTPIDIHWEERFHPEKNPDGSLPLLAMGEREHNTKFSDFWLKEITYLRLKNMNLSYSLPADVVSTIGLKNARVYATANNLWTITTLGIWSNAFDPEANKGHDGYPPHRVYTLGLTISL